MIETKLTEMTLPEEKVLEKLNAVSTAKRVANMVSIGSIFFIFSCLCFFVKTLRPRAIGSFSQPHNVSSPNLPTFFYVIYHDNHFVRTLNQILTRRSCTTPTSGSVKRSTRSRPQNGSASARSKKPIQSKHDYLDLAIARVQRSWHEALCNLPSFVCRVELSG